MWSINDLMSGHPSPFSYFLEMGYGSGCLSWGQTPVVPNACQRASSHPKFPACSHQTPVGLGLVSLVLPAQGSPTLRAAPSSHQHSGRSVCLELQAQRLILWACSHAPYVPSVCWPIGCSGVGSLRSCSQVCASLLALRARPMSDHFLSSLGLRRASGALLRFLSDLGTEDIGRGRCCLRPPADNRRPGLIAGRGKGGLCPGHRLVCLPHH